MKVKTLKVNFKSRFFKQGQTVFLMKSDSNSLFLVGKYKGKRKYIYEIILLKDVDVQSLKFGEVNITEKEYILVNSVLVY